MILNKYIFVTFLVFLTNAQNSCKTADNKDGECIPIKSCASIMNILRSLSRPIPESTVQHLRKNLCRSDNQTHFVCCDSIQNHQMMNSVTEHPNIRFLSNLNCGDELLQDNILIGHGDQTMFLEYPWMALLRYQTSKGLQFQCGGTLIHSRYILTAAHCVKGIPDTLVSVRLGEHDLSTETDCDENDANYCAPPVQDIDVETVIPHPDYNKPSYSNDIALIRLSKETIFNDAVSPICLPLTEEFQQLNLTKVIISGWGLTEKNIASNVLLKGNVPVIPNSDCEQFYQRAGVKLSDKQLCAGGERYSDSCRGDSGGPLFVLGNYKNTQFGIISAGAVQCGRGYPVIFTRVALYLNWILDQIKE